MLVNMPLAVGDNRYSFVFCLHLRVRPSLLLFSGLRVHLRLLSSLRFIIANLNGYPLTLETFLSMGISRIYIVCDIVYPWAVDVLRHVRLHKLDMVDDLHTSQLLGNLVCWLVGYVVCWRIGYAACR